MFSSEVPAPPAVMFVSHVFLVLNAQMNQLFFSSLSLENVREREKEPLTVNLQQPLDHCAILQPGGLRRLAIFGSLERWIVKHELVERARGPQTESACFVSCFRK